MTIRDISPPLSLKFDCKQYRGTAEELFQRYLDLGFIYPEKRKRLEPVWDSVLETWQRILDLPRELSLVLEHEDSSTGAWTTMHLWKHTRDSWQAQHLASTGGGLGSRAVMLAIQDFAERIGGSRAAQIWFSPSNPFAKRVFGSVGELGECDSSVVDISYFGVEVNSSWPGNTSNVEQLRATEPGLIELASLVRGELFVRSESLDGNDLELESFEDGYGRCGLRRSRRVFVIRDQGGIAAAIFVYRSSLGINLSLLENRCELLVRPDLDRNARDRMVMALIRRAMQEYESFEPGFMPLAVEAAQEELLLARGARLLRRYRLAGWSSDVYRANAARMDRFFDRITRRSARN